MLLTQKDLKTQINRIALNKDLVLFAIAFICLKSIDGHVFSNWRHVGRVRD